jgi:hypothetical protein
MRPIELFKTVHLPFYDFSALDALDHYGTALEIPHKGSRRAPQSAGIAPLYAIEGFVHVALDHSELAAIDGDLVIGATLLHALIMDADRHRAFVRAPPVHLEPEQASDDHSRHRDDPNSHLFHEDPYGH